jgi:hypothetical protein
MPNIPGFTLMDSIVHTGFSLSEGLCATPTVTMRRETRRRLENIRLSMETPPFLLRRTIAVVMATAK